MTDADVLVVGAGPTGLTLAASLHAGGARVRIVDQHLDRAHESRALAVQPRSLEVLRGFGLADELVRRGNPAVRLRIHAGRRTVPVRLFDIGVDDTAYPFLLFVSQAETEAVLGDHLAAAGVRVERGVRFEQFRRDGDRIVCTLRHPDGTEQEVRVSYLAGCDGMRSTVRDRAGIRFAGSGYPQTFLLADLDVDGLEPGTVNTFLADTGPLLFFPLGHPAPWRIITMRAQPGPDEARETSLAELQGLTDATTGGRIRLHDPVWMSVFQLHHRQAARYRSGPVFLAGDAAHVHSPVGAQGMNTGLQDAVNLGWKLALVCRGVAPRSLLETYDAERRPVGDYVLRFTDRGFAVATSTHPVVRGLRTHVAPRLVPVVLRFAAGRKAAFRTVSQLGIHYRSSPGVAPGRRFGSPPRPGDRLPDAQVTRDGEQCWLQQALAAPAFHLLLAGPVGGWDEGLLTMLIERHGSELRVHRLDRRSRPGLLGDPSGTAFGRLHVRGSAHFVVRPDGHVGYRADHRDFAGAAAYLASWLPGA